MKGRSRPDTEERRCAVCLKVKGKAEFDLVKSGRYNKRACRSTMCRICRNASKRSRERRIKITPRRRV